MRISDWSSDVCSSDLYLAAYGRRVGGTILLASHNMSEVERLCDSVLMMKRGRIVDTGAPHELIARYGRTTLEEVFLDIDRKRAGVGKSVSVRVDLGGRLVLKKKNKTTK